MRKLLSKGLFLFAALSLVVGNMGISLSFSLPVAQAAPKELGIKADKNGADKVTICHATGSQTNPWVRINISENAVGAHLEHHDDIIVPDNDDTYQCPEVGPYCGDGEFNPSLGEECDDGEGNRDNMEPIYDHDTAMDRTYCSTSCELYEVPGEYCGDELINGPEECDDGPNGSDSCTADCTLVEEPEEHGPWCSALLGIVGYAIDSGIYNDVADINNDQTVNQSDWDLAVQWHGEGLNETCYQQFEDPEGEYHFQCEDPNVGWCEGLLQGVKDYTGSQEGDGEYFHVYDLNDDGTINLSDLTMVAQLINAGDEVACYSYYVPPFFMCENPEPECGNYKVEAGEECDDGPNGSNSCTADCTVISNPGPPVCIGCGGGGDTAPYPANIEVAQSCDEPVTISWTTSKDSLTWLLYGQTDAYGDEYKDSDYNKSVHSVSLSGLEAGTTYHYLVKTESIADKQASDYDRTFTTLTAEQCGGGGTEPEPEPEPEGQVLGEKEYNDFCEFVRPSGSHGVDFDIAGVFEFPDGSLLRDACSPTMEVYKIVRQQKWHVPNIAYLVAHFLGQRIYNVPSEVLDDYPDYVGSVLGVKQYGDGTLLRGSDHKIYLIDDGKKHYIADLQALKHYAGRPIIDVSDDVLADYPNF